jgi:hypothetical protein
VSVRHSREAYTGRRLYLGALRLGPLQIAGCRRAGQVRPHRTAPRRGERGAAMTRWSDDWRRAIRGDRRRRGFTGLHGRAL